MPKYVNVTDGRIISAVEEVLYFYPQLEEYVVKVCQGPLVGDGHLAGKYFYDERKIVMYWRRPYSTRSNADVQHVVVHEMMHAYNAWFEDQGGRVIFSYPDYEVAREVSEYSLKSPGEMFAEVMAFKFNGRSNPTLDHLYRMIVDNIYLKGGE